MRPGIDCLLVYDSETLHMTCQEDWNHDMIEEDSLGFSNDFRAEIRKYRAELKKHPESGFGNRHLTQ